MASSSEKTARFVVQEINSSSCNEKHVCSELGKIFSRVVRPLTVTGRFDIDQRSVHMLQWDGSINAPKAKFLAIIASNQDKDVTELLTQLQILPARDQVVKLEIFVKGVKGDGVWISHPRLPCATIWQLFSVYLKIRVNSTKVLDHFISIARNRQEKYGLARFKDVEGSLDYTICDVLRSYPSVSIDAATLASLLPLITPSFYPIPERMSPANSRSVLLRSFGPSELTNCVSSIPFGKTVYAFISSEEHLRKIKDRVQPKEGSPSPKAVKKSICHATGRVE